MYYFLILELLQSNQEKQYSVLDVFAELSKQQECNYNNVRRQLFKLSLNHPHIFRVERDIPIVRVAVNQSGKSREFVYFYRKF